MDSIEWISLMDNMDGWHYSMLCYFKYFQHWFNTVPSKSTSISQEVFRKGERALYGGTWHFTGGHDNFLETMYIILPLLVSEWLFILSQ